MLFGGFSVYTKSMFLLARIWQGKALMVNLLFPFILLELRGLYMQKKCGYSVLALMLCCLCGIALNPIALFMIPMIYVGMSVCALFRRRTIRRIFFAFISIIPIAVHAPIYYFTMVGFYGGNTENVFVDAGSSLDFWSIVGNYFQEPWYILLAIIAIPIAIYTKNPAAKQVFVTAVITWIVLFINPVVAPFIAQYITNPAVYWRVIWLLPYEFACAYALVNICDILSDKIDRRIRVPAMIVCVFLLIMGGGKYTFAQSNGFFPHDNIEKIPNVVQVQADEILSYGEKEAPLVLAPGLNGANNHAIALRQYTDKIRLLHGRDFLSEIMLANPIKTEFPYSKEDVYGIYTDPGAIDAEDWLKSIRGYGVNWVIYPDDGTADSILNQIGIEKVSASEGFVLYRVGS